MNQLVLSLFPGIGLLDRAFEEEWPEASIVRGPDPLWGGDIRRFHPPAGKFDGIIGGPPCQAFSRLAHMVRQNGLEPKFGNLIPEFERCVDEAGPQWFLMEEVPDAPRPQVRGYASCPLMLNNRQCFASDGNPAIPNRLRAITFGWRGEFRSLLVETAALENVEFEYAGIGGSFEGKRKAFGNYGKEFTTLPFNAKSWAAAKVICRKQGLPESFLDELPFTAEAACKAIGNGVPIPMGRTIARAVKEALSRPKE